jgi:hypothetical protein
MFELILTLVLDGERQPGASRLYPFQSYEVCAHVARLGPSASRAGAPSGVALLVVEEGEYLASDDFKEHAPNAILWRCQEVPTS